MLVRFCQQCICHGGGDGGGWGFLHEKDLCGGGVGGVFVGGRTFSFGGVGDGGRAVCGKVGGSTGVKKSGAGRGDVDLCHGNGGIWSGGRSNGGHGIFCLGE